MLSMSTKKCKLKQDTIRTHLRTAKIGTTDNAKCWQGCGATGTPIHCRMHNGTDTLEGSLAVSYKTKHTLAICHHIDIFTQMFIAALFIIIKTQKEASCPSVKWMHKLWYIQTMHHYSALKINELSSYEKAWRKLKCISLSERSPSEKAIYHMIPNIRYYRKGKT